MRELTLKEVELINGADRGDAAVAGCIGLVGVVAATTGGVGGILGGTALCGIGAGGAAFIYDFFA